MSDTSPCHFLIGPAGSGKTTFATKLLALNPSLVHISTDAIRLKLFGDARLQGGWAAIDAEICQQMQLAHAQGRAVIYDATNIKRPWRLAFIQKYVSLYPNWLGWHLQTPLDICLSQNQLRERQVPEEVITGHYQALKTFPPEAAEGFLAIATIGQESKMHRVILPEQPEIKQVIATAPKKHTKRDNCYGAQDLHRYSRLVDFERLLYLLALLAEHPAAGEIQLLPREEQHLTTEVAQALATQLSQRQHPIYGDPKALAEDLRWLDQVGLIHRTLPVAPVQLTKPPLLGNPHPTETLHTYGDWSAFESLLYVVGYILHQPLAKEEGEATYCTLAQRVNQSFPVHLDENGNLVRRYVERVLRPYGLLPETSYRHGYYAGTAIFSPEELRQVQIVLASQAQSLKNPLDQEIYEKFEHKLVQTKIISEPYPIRAIANRVIVETDAKTGNLPVDSLFKNLDRLEQAILTGALVELSYRQDRNHWQDEQGQSFRVWPLQILFHNIAWYLAYEVQQDLLLRITRMDRLFLRQNQQTPRGDKAQRKSLKNLQTLMAPSPFLFLGNSAHHQKLYLNSKTRAEVEVELELWFTEKLFKFIEEGEKRFNKAKPRYGKTPDPQFPRSLKVRLPVWTLEDIEFLRWILAYNHEVKVIGPQSLVAKMQTTVQQMAQIYAG